MTDSTVDEVQKEAERQALLTKWFTAQQKLADICKPLVDEEMALRKQVFAEFFPTPEEGVNDHKLTGGFVLKGTHKIERKVDEAMLSAKEGELIKAGIPMNELIEMKPKLATKEYRKLSAEQRKLFEQVLDIKIGAPQMEIVKPKR